MIAQDDFGSLGIPIEEVREGMLDIMDHPALSRQNSEKSLGDLELRSDSRVSSNSNCVCDISDEISILLSRRTLPTKPSAVQGHVTQVSLVNGKEPIRRITSFEGSLPPPRRFPRRKWVGLVKRYTDFLYQAEPCDLSMRP
jgi:hypothetical protein